LHDSSTEKINANGRSSIIAAVNASADQILTPAKTVTHKEVLDIILESINKKEFEEFAVEKQGFRQEGDDRKAQEILKEHEKETKQKHQIVLCILFLLETVKKHKYSLARKNDFLFVYNGQYWREVERLSLIDFLGKAAEKMGVFSLEALHYDYRNRLYNQFLSAAKLEPVEPDKNKVLINLQNGTFEITAKSQSLREFRAEDFLHHQLPFEYNEAAKAPLFENYLSEVLPTKNVQGIIAEFLGYVFTRNLKLEKSLLLYGSGANGKSVLFDIMNALLGRENITNYSLSDLTEEHNRARIANKLLNYGSEINASAVRDVFKNLVSGEPIQVRLKYGNPFLMEDYAKLCFNCNELPKDIDQSEAYFRRLIIAPFGVTIPEAKQDKRLAQKIIDTELAGVFNWILEGLRRVLKQERFSDCPETEAILKKYRTESDTVAMFIDEERYEKVDGDKDYIAQKDLYKRYREYCFDAGYKPLGRNNFGKRLEAQGFRPDKKEVGRVIYIRQA